MQFTIEREKLAEAVKVASRIADSQARVLGTNGIVITAADSGQLTLRSTNLMVQTTVQATADVTVAGSAVIPALTAAELVQRLPGETVAVEVTEKGLLVKSGRSRSTLHLIQDDPPVLDQPADDAPVSWTTDGATWVDMARRHLDMAATDDTRPVLKGVLFKFSDQSLSVVTTDGTRLAHSRYRLPEPVAEPQSFIIPASAIREAAHYRGAATIQFGPKVAVWTFGETTMVTRYVDGQYPPFERVIPTEYGTTVQVPTEVMRGAIGRMQILSSKARTPMITLSVSHEALTIEAQTAEVGSGVEEIEAHVTGDAIRMSFNPRFLVDALKPIQNELLNIQFSAVQSPARISDAANPSYEVIVLPLREIAAVA